MLAILNPEEFLDFELSENIALSSTNNVNVRIIYMYMLISFYVVYRYKEPYFGDIYMYCHGIECSIFLHKLEANYVPTSLG